MAEITTYATSPTTSVIKTLQNCPSLQLPSAGLDDIKKIITDPPPEETVHQYICDKSVDYESLEDLLEVHTAV